MDRHGRQSRLAEIGASGQERIACAEAAVPLGGLAGEVAARYLAGAGVLRLRVKSDAAARAALAVDPGARVQVDTALPDASGASPFGLRDHAADDVARGAHVALVELRRALGIAP